MMKDNGSLNSKMINRNWVLKRKRRKLPCGPDVSKGKESISFPIESPTNTSSKRRLKNDMTLDHPLTKKKGNDGHYYECMACDLGGILLCCDSCPRTYHLECLNPPLKQTPTGPWQCPFCHPRGIFGDGSVEPTKHLDPISKRARTKITIGKSKSTCQSSNIGKVSRIFGSSIIGRKRSSGKGKSSASGLVQSVGKELESSGIDASCSSKKGQPSSGGVSIEGSSSCMKDDDENKHQSSPRDGPEEKGSLSPAKENVSLSRATNDEASESKLCLSSNNGSPENKVASELKTVIDKDRKRKLKIHTTDSQKKPRTIKIKFNAGTPKKNECKTSSSRQGTCKSQRKQKKVEHSASSMRMPKDDAMAKGVDIQVEDEVTPSMQMVSGEATHLSHESHEAGTIVVEMQSGEDHAPSEVLQVDRVLGCRLQSDKINDSLNISMPAANESPLENLLIPERQNSQSEENSSCGVAVDVISGEEFVKGSRNVLSRDEGESINVDTTVEKIQVYRRSMAKKCKEGNATDSVNRDIKDFGSMTVIGKNQDVFLASTGYLTKKVEEAFSGEKAKNEDNGEVLNNHETPESHEITDSKNVDMWSENKLGCKKETKEPILIPSASSHSPTNSFEFLVKWIGKAHIHNCWIPESQLKVLAKRKLDNYKTKYGTALINICEERWKLPQRVIALRSSRDGSTEAFVKWTGLSYDECTWERVNEPVIKKSSYLIDLCNRFECQMLDRNAKKDLTLRPNVDSQQNEVVTLTEQPEELQGGSLFPHQLEALNWLRKCWYKCKNVILADEMGLGKTVSACAFISSLYFEFKAMLPCLVLVPLSTMPNWMAEFALWAPNLNVVEYHGCAKARAIIRQYEWHASGPSRSNKKTAGYKFNVLLTTYEMVLVDSSHLRGIPWEVLVVDEGHRLKNSSSKLFSMLNTFSFQHRVLLTGTPLQNNIGEMYNLLNFLQPSSFPSLSSFEEKFNDLTTAEKVEELKKLVAPHMLRRLKKDAMQNIPPKTERMVPVELSSIQAEYYRAMLTKNYQILRNIGKGVAQQSMLNIVMQLRKVCNHPYLIPGTEPDAGSLQFLHEMRIKASAKLTLLHSMLKVLYKEGHRVLIFSQMTKLLDILEDYLTIEFGLRTFERVDGSVSVADRQAAIARFNQDKSRFVFLLSTRSCGLGINLATADTVIIYDSDFNPHADIQAMNRAHRIGQSKRLLVYRLVVRASVEERILQLAKKKLMLDQLFVNKSGSQKEVEDILRWGTEELFNDSSSITGKDSGEKDSNNDEAVVDVEHKHKRRARGLGDVYKDKCTDGSNKIVWDENAILKLLDRSNLQAESPDNAEVDIENDMLGAVKSVDWNDEPTEELGTESLPVVSNGTCGQNSEKKEDNLAGGTEENDWDRILRVRWEKYQSEEEAALGRGKRQRKAVSYREAYAPHPGETLSESGAEGEPEPEQELEREYTSAGRAHKAKYVKLRVRQKERLAQIKAIDPCAPTEGPLRPESLPQAPVHDAQDRNTISKLVQPAEENFLTVDLEKIKCDHNLETPHSKTESTLSLGKISKHKLGSHLDYPVKFLGYHSPDLPLASHNLQGTSYANLGAINNLSPVLGLCAPNANQMEPLQRNFLKSQSKQSRQALGSEFPFHIAPRPGTSGDMAVKGQENVPDKLKLPEVSPETWKHQPKDGFPDNFPPFSLCPPPVRQGRSSETVEHAGASFSEFPEKMALPKLPFDEKLLPRYPFPTGSLNHLFPDLFPSLSLGSRVGDAVDSNQNFPAMPSLPNLKLSQDAVRNNLQESDIPPNMGLGQMPPTFSSFPEHHRKVLENIMRSGLKKKSKIDIWSEDELDFLWIGVRRHGRGRWDAMLRDPRLRFSKFKTPEDLAERWEEEQLKMLDMSAHHLPKPFKPTKSAKSSLFPEISDGMMTRALHGGRFGWTSKFQAHLTDMKLGFGDLSSSLPHLDPSDQLGLQQEHFPPIPTWNTDKFRANNFHEDWAAGPSNRTGAPSNVQIEQPFLLNTSGSTSLGSFNLSRPGNINLLHEDDQGASKCRELPRLLDKSRNFLLGGESTSSSLLPDFNKGRNTSPLKGKDEVAGSSSSNKLPHWLREVVNAPAKPTSPDLPPTVSAIAQSVRLLYGEKNSTIPPFVLPGPPPSQPKDPRRSLKKKKRNKPHSLGEFSVDMAGPSHISLSSLHGDNAVPPPILPPSPFPLFSQSAAGTSGHPSIEPNLIIPPLNLNMLHPLSSSTVYSNPQKWTGPGLAPPPVVLQLVASCTAPGPVPSTTSSVLIESRRLPSPGELPDSKDADEDQDANQSSPVAHNTLSEIKLERTRSGDSSKTESDPAPRERPDVEEISSEGTVSDHPVSDHER